MWKTRAVAESGLRKTMSVSNSSLCFLPQSVGHPDLQGVGERIARMPEVWAESLFIISLLFRKWKSRTWKAIEGWSQARASEHPVWAPGSHSWPRDGAVQAQAVSYFAFPRVRAGPQRPLEHLIRGQFELLAGRPFSTKYFCQKFCCKKVCLEYSEGKKFSPEGALSQELFFAGFLHFIDFFYPWNLILCI